MSDRIELRGLRVAAVVGVLAEERLREQPLSLDLDIERPLDEASARDDVAATTNYAEVLALAVRVAREGRFALLETLADRVARAVRDADPAIQRVSVTVRKLRPPVPEDVATVGVRRSVGR